MKNAHKDGLLQFKQNYEIINEKEKKYKSDLKLKVIYFLFRILIFV